MAVVLSIFNPAYVASMQALKEAQARPVAPVIKAPPPTAHEKSERSACRSERQMDLTRDFGGERRNAITRLWVLSGCKACGACEDMLVG